VRVSSKKKKRKKKERKKKKKRKLVHKLRATQRASVPSPKSNNFTPA
jgi:hypothetical protein